MTEDQLNTTLNHYVSSNLSPKEKQCDYIDQKYQELKQILGGNTFRSGSYARYTAVDPVHDLDVIYPVTDVTVESNPRPVILALLKQLQDGYKNSSTKVKEIKVQTHSATIILGDAPAGSFSIDVVPAVKLDETNEFGQNLFMVPEILRLNQFNRQQRYLNASNDNPIGWIKSDPKGYVKAAQLLNEDNPNFRHAVRLVKSWRHACKITYRDSFRLKSFHVEQIVYEFFATRPGATTLDAIVETFALLPSYLAKPQIPDRADSHRLIDEYLDDLSENERRIILQQQSRALNIATRLAAATSTTELEKAIESVLAVSATPTSAAPSRQVAPSQPWSL